MKQYVLDPNRGKNVLDLLTKDHELMSRVVVEDTQLSGHRLVIIKTNLTANETLVVDDEDQENLLSTLKF